jgi:uncharacterized lipoprotein YddW (UPF0748 family)
MVLALPAWALQPKPISPEPPPLAREMRGMWVASVGNIDWPSRPGLSTAQQQSELRALLNLALRLRLNTVILQVRTGADALYASSLEPWSEYLTGRMGQAPSPAYDPLRFACDEAHARGLELHAWFNPFRARYNKTVSPLSSGHLIQRHPDWIIAYGPYRWLDPGIPEARDHVLKVALDIVSRYDIDGLHFDDYFYPYPIKVADGVLLPFDDGRSYERYRRGGGRLDQGDWRRDCVNRFVESLYSAVHRAKPWVKVGISPFGIWRPNNPPGIRGLDQYGLLYADPMLWLNSGWCDYMAPQLYWALSQREQAFDPLLRWWGSQNTRKRLLVPGLNSAEAGGKIPPVDILKQVQISRQDRADGVLFWNASSLQDNQGGVAAALGRDLFSRPALVPATPWLGKEAPGAPKLEGKLSLRNALLSLKWEPDTNAVVRVQVLRSRYGLQWMDETLPPQTRERSFDRRLNQGIPDEVRLVPVGRTGMAGESAVWVKP